MDAYRIHVFHGTDDDAVVRAVPHDFKFDFLPSRDASFHKNLIDRRKFDAAVGNFFHFIPVVSNTAAGTAERVRRTDDHRITDLIGKCYRRFQFFKISDSGTG